MGQIIENNLLDNNLEVFLHQISDQTFEEQDEIWVEFPNVLFLSGAVPGLQARL